MTSGIVSLLLLLTAAPDAAPADSPEAAAPTPVPPTSPAAPAPQTCPSDQPNERPPRHWHDPRTRPTLRPDMDVRRRLEVHVQRGTATAVHVDGDEGGGGLDQQAAAARQWHLRAERLVQCHIHPGLREGRLVRLEPHHRERRQGGRRGERAKTERLDQQPAADQRRIRVALRELADAALGEGGTARSFGDPPL